MSDVFDIYEEELNIKALSSSANEEMEIVAMCTIDTEGKYEFTITETDEFIEETQHSGTLTHFSGVEIRYMQALKKDKSAKVREYVIDYDKNTYIVVYSAPLADFKSGLAAANKIAKSIKRK